MSALIKNTGGVSVSLSATTNNVGAGGNILIAAVADRLAITLQAPQANTANLWIGGSPASVGEGVELQPGERIILNTNAPIRVSNGSGAVQVINTLAQT